MVSKHENYYNQKAHWERDLYENKDDKIRINEIINTIPEDCKSILDVGCGNGALINTIQNTEKNRYIKIVGTDISEEALKHVKSEKILASIDKLPFLSNDFDINISSEVIEHLPYQTFINGLKEMERVAKEYILLTVPNNEDLESSLYCCPKCFCWYNHVYHMHSFTKSKLKTLFKNFKLINVKEIGPKQQYHKYNLYTRLWYRYRKKRIPPPYAICPQCGYKTKDIQKDTKPIYKTDTNNFWGGNQFRKYLSNLIVPKKFKRRWLLALYQKK